MGESSDTRPLLVLTVSLTVTQPHWAEQSALEEILTSEAPAWKPKH